MFSVAILRQIVAQSKLRSEWLVLSNLSRNTQEHRLLHGHLGTQEKALTMKMGTVKSLTFYNSNFYRTTYHSTLRFG